MVEAVGGTAVPAGAELGRLLERAAGVGEAYDRDDPDLKFGNSDVSLDAVVEQNGGHFLLANMDILADTSW